MVNGMHETHIQVVKRREYVVTVGFETNVDSAFVYKIHDRGRDRFTRDLTQILDEDYGHAFFICEYATLNNVVQAFFSFGPNGLPKKDKFYSAQRQGTADYLIKEKCIL